MKIGVPSTLRGRMFLVLMLVSVIPAALTLLAGTIVLREVVVSTGSAGAWDEVADSGRELFEQIEGQESPAPELVAATERHQAALAESVRFSRVYAFIGERVLILLPLLAILLVLLVGLLALAAANWLSKGFSRPVEELVAWTRSLASGAPLPSSDSSDETSEITEFSLLRDALRTTSEELVLAREREVEQARMRSWSDMARKVAHELRNPLTPMAMAADRVVHSKEPAVSAAGEVLRDEIGRLEELARAFSQFGRTPEGPMSPIDLRELLATLARRLSAEGVSVRLDAPDAPIFILGHLEAVDRVVRNLLANAHDAVEARASLHSRSALADEDRALEEEPIRMELTRLEGGVEMRVLDRGTGIPEEALSRIWEPEFTMKRRGTGLGLAMVRQVVRAHGGEVLASNREGGGAAFIVRLPSIEVSTADRGAVVENDSQGHRESQLETGPTRSDPQVSTS